MNRQKYLIRNIANKKALPLDGEKTLLTLKKKRTNTKHLLRNSSIISSAVIADFKYSAFKGNNVKITFKLLISIAKKNGEKCSTYMNIEKMSFVKYILLNLKTGKL